MTTEEIDLTAHSRKSIHCRDSGGNNRHRRHCTASRTVHRSTALDRLSSIHCHSLHSLSEDRIHRICADLQNTAFRTLTQLLIVSNFNKFWTSHQRAGPHGFSGEQTGGEIRVARIRSRAANV